MQNLVKKVRNVFTVKEYIFISEKKHVYKFIDFIKESTEHKRKFKNVVETNPMTVSIKTIDDKLFYDIGVFMNEDQWYRLLSLCNNEDYKLVIKDTPDKMYVTK